MIRSLPLCTLALAAVLATPDAWAFAPVQDGAPGIEGTRVLRFDPQIQAHLAHQPAWQRFVQGEGRGWQARFDEQMGTPHRMWGGPIDIGPTDTAPEVVHGMLAFVDRHPDLLGADAKDLALRSIHYDDGLATWYVDFDVLIDGMPVQNGGITARVKYGHLVMLGADTYPEAALTGPVRLDEANAVAIGLKHGPAPQAVHTDIGAALVTVPVVGDDGALVLRPAWRVSSRTKDPVGIWDTWVDADTGQVFGARNAVRYFAGSVVAEHDVRTVDGNTTVSPLPSLEITDGTNTVNTDASGDFDLPGDQADAKLDSPYFGVVNSSGNDAELVFDSGTGTFDDASSTPAERDAYVFLHRVRAWGEKVSPGLPFDRILAKVNESQTCNAYYDGSLNFFQAGSGCNNSGRIADVIYHEWGHAFHFYSLESGTYDPSLSEGAADTVAFLQTGDPHIAPGFFTSGQSIRNVAPNRVYPDDYVPNDQFSHENGLIFGGAIWDLWQGLEDEYGADEGTRRTDHIFAGLLKGGPTIEESYDEAVFADDDNGDLSDGTPNQCEIVDAFAQHGLGPAGNGPTFLVHHEPLHGARALEDPSFDADLTASAPKCVSLQTTGGKLHVRVDGGAWNTFPLTAQGTTVHGALPPLPPGSFVEYWAEVDDPDGGVAKVPDGGEINPFSYYVGDVIPVHCDHFETSDGGYTHEAIGPHQAAGADDWQWGVPQGKGGDPDAAASGQKVWGNDLGLDGGDGRYANGIRNRLDSPVIDTTHYQGVFLSYDRWLGVEDATYDHAKVLINGQEVWGNWANATTGTDETVDRQWSPQAIDLQGLADRTQVTISFELSSDAGLNFGGWTIDNVCLMAPATPDNRLGIDDFVAQGDGSSGVQLSWTNPTHPPLRDVVVVRKRGRFPTGPHDGKVVFRDKDPQLGAAESTLDDSAGNKTGFYAVYAYDGHSWLSWTVTGWNAAAAVTSGVPDAPKVAGGCDTGAGTGFATPAWLLLGLLALRRRRRVA